MNPREKLIEAAGGNYVDTTENHLDAFLAHPDELLECLFDAVGPNIAPIYARVLARRTPEVSPNG